MSDPYSTLLELNATTLTCNLAQSWVDSARRIFPTDQWFQLELDRMQAEIDTHRTRIQLLMLDIPSRN